MLRTARIVGVVLLVAGVVWAFQGSGVLGGSFMTGQQSWLVIGIITALVGVAVLAWAYSRH